MRGRKPVPLCGRWRNEQAGPLPSFLSLPMLRADAAMSVQVTVEIPEDAARLLGEEAGQFGREMLVAAILR